MTALVLDQLNLICNDMDATLSFYRILGLDIPESTVWRTESGPHHVEIKMPNGFELAFDSIALCAVTIAARLSLSVAWMARAHFRQEVPTDQMLTSVSSRCSPWKTPFCSGVNPAYVSTRKRSRRLSEMEGKYNTVQ